MSNFLDELKKCWSFKQRHLVANHIGAEAKRKISNIDPVFNGNFYILCIIDFFVCLLLFCINSVTGWGGSLEPSPLLLLLEVSQWKAGLISCQEVQKESKAKAVTAGTVHRGQAGPWTWRQETGQMWAEEGPERLLGCVRRKNAGRLWRNLAFSQWKWRLRPRGVCWVAHPPWECPHSESKSTQASWGGRVWGDAAAQPPCGPPELPSHLHSLKH